MARRKTATRAGSASARRKKARKKTGATTAKRGRATRAAAKTGSSRKRSGRRTGAGKAIARASAARGSAAGRETAGRQQKRLEDVTDEVQGRWDAEEEDVPTPPSTLDLDRRASAARTGRAEMLQRQRKHTAASPTITGGDVDADWEQAYFVGDEAATGDNPTPDQSAVEDIGRAVGVDYEDTEELKSTPKIDRRDKKRWELDPASAEDYKERNKKRGR